MVHFEKTVTILNPDGDKKNKKKSAKKETAPLAPTKPGIMKVGEKKNTPKMKRKEQKPNSTSRMTLHDDKQAVQDDEAEIEQSKATSILPILAE